MEVISVIILIKEYVVLVSDDSVVSDWCYHRNSNGIATVVVKVKMMQGILMTMAIAEERLWCGDSNGECYCGDHGCFS